jgi:hypothetical protein
MNKLKLKLLVVVGFAFGLIGASVAAPGSPVLTSDNCIISGTLGPAQVLFSPSPFLLPPSLPFPLLLFLSPFFPFLSFFFMFKQVKEIQKAEHPLFPFAFHP